MGKNSLKWIRDLKKPFAWHKIQWRRQKKTLDGAKVEQCYITAILLFF